MKGRPHSSPDCRCAACVQYDREQEDTSPYAWWSDETLSDYAVANAQSVYAAERAAWQALIDMYDAVFRDDTRDDS